MIRITTIFMEVHHSDTIDGVNVRDSYSLGLLQDQPFSEHLAKSGVPEIFAGIVMIIGPEFECLLFRREKDLPVWLGALVCTVTDEF